MTGVLLAYATVSCDAARWAVSPAVQIRLQGSLMVLATLERANDGTRPASTATAITERFVVGVMP